MKSVRQMMFWFEYSRANFIDRRKSALCKQINKVIGANLCSFQNSVPFFFNMEMDESFVNDENVPLLVFSFDMKPAEFLNFN